MAFTLAEMRTGMDDKIAEQVVDIFLRESEILQMLEFDDTVAPQGGSTMTYTYLQKVLPVNCCIPWFEENTPIPQQPWQRNQQI